MHPALSFVRSVVFVVVAVGVLTGCASFERVTIDDAPVDAPRSERLEYHRNHKGGFEEVDGIDGTETQFVLADGTQVQHPADLLPAVGEDTPAAESIQQFEEAMDSYSFWAGLLYWPIPVGLGVPAVIWTVGLGAQQINRLGVPNAVGDGLFVAFLVAGAGVCVGAAAVSTLGWCISPSREADMYKAREIAFKSYNKSLEIHLRLDDTSLDDDEPSPTSPADVTDDGEGFDEGMQGW